MKTLEDIAIEAAKLSEKEWDSLASRLLHGQESPVSWVFDEEVLSRMHEADEDPGVMITFDELVFGLQCRHKDALGEAKLAIEDGSATFSDWEDAKERIRMKTERKEFEP
jgi:hypothetical protein